MAEKKDPTIFRIELDHARSFLAEILGVIDVAVEGLEVVRQAEEIARQKAELPAELADLERRRDSLKLETANRQKQLDDLDARYRQLEADWHGLRKMASGES